MKVINNFKIKNLISEKIFIDRPSKPFELILNSLRTNRELRFPDDEVEYNNLMVEIYYFGLKKYFENGITLKGKFVGSKLLTSKYQKIINKWLNNKKKDWKLIYRGTVDGFSSYNFHSKCDNQGATIIVIESSNGYIFGGYNNDSWASSGGKILIFFF
jgi:hypothetical protein